LAVFHFSLCPLPQRDVPVTGRAQGRAYGDRMSSQYIYTMNRVSKVVPPKRQIIKDISLSFFPGAKIGLLGLNGAGKSTVLKIMAGVDKDFEGEARPPRKAPTSTRWPRNRSAWRRSWPLATRTPWRTSWTWPPMRCACRRGMPWSASCPVVKSAA
jgi:ABC-type uncharacterized transport system ATPase subunit